MRVVMVLWEDSVSRHGWRPVDDYLPAKVLSIGYLVGETQASLTLSSSWDMDDLTGDVVDPLTIPKGCILHVSDVGDLPASSSL